MTVLIIFVVGLMNVACFLIGAHVGQKVVNGEPVELPKLNPMEAIRESRERHEAQVQQDRLDTIMENIEAYNGTGDGQKDVM